MNEGEGDLVLFDDANTVMELWRLVEMDSRGV
jgi:hypothetical protein